MTPSAAKIEIGMGTKIKLGVLAAILSVVVPTGVSYIAWNATVRADIDQLKAEKAYELQKRDAIEEKINTIQVDVASMKATLEEIRRRQR